MSRQIAWVRWGDACYERGELRAAEVTPSCFLESAGLVVREDKQHISIATDCYPVQPGCLIPTFRHISHIPKINIVEIRRFSVPEKGRGSKKR